MKNMSCDLCSTTFSSETFDDWFKQMQEHYLSEHMNFMKAAKNKTKEEGLQWMQTMKQKFDSL